MELDDLKRVWSEYDRKLDSSLRLNTRLLRDSMLGKVQRALTRLTLLLVVDLLFFLGVALWLGSSFEDYAAEVRFLVPAVAVQLCAIVLVIASARQLVAISRVDYGAPIVTIQKRLESLRIERIRTMKWTLLLSPLAGTPLVIVLFERLFDLDVYAAFGIRWVVANLVFGLLVIAAGTWIARRYADRMQRSPRFQGLLRDIAGYNLNAATGFLSSLSQFAEEETAGEPSG